MSADTIEDSREFAADCRSLYRQVSKGMLAIHDSTPLLRASLFRTEKVDLVALYNLVGLPEWADATTAKLKARQDAQHELGEDDAWDPYATEEDEDYYDDDGGNEEEMKRLDNVQEDVIKLHPLLRALEVMRKPDGGFGVQLKGNGRMEDLPAMHENATQPPLGRTSVGVHYRFGRGGSSKRLGRPMHKSTTPLTVSQVVTTLTDCLETENGFVEMLRERLLRERLPVPVPDPQGTMVTLRVSDVGKFELEFEY